MEHAGSGLLVLTVLLAGAVFAPLLAPRARIPAAVLLIGYGVVVGPHGVGWIGVSPVEGFLHELGFVVLMFLAGLEIDVNGLRHRGPRAILLRAGVATLVPLLALLAAQRLGLTTLHGLALGAMSVGLPLAVLRETGHLRTPLGQEILVLGSIGEFVTVIAMTLLDLGLRPGGAAVFLAGLARLVAFLALSGLALRSLGALAWWHPERVTGLVSEPTSEIGVRASLLVMAAFSLLAWFAGVDPIVGAFLAGALIAFVLRGKQVLEEKLSVVGHGFLVPVFFVGVGVRFDPSVVTPRNLLVVAGLLVVLVLARLVPTLALVGRGLGAREALATAALLSSPLTLMVAIATLGAHLGVLDEPARGALVLLAVASGVAFPLAFRWLAPQK